MKIVIEQSEMAERLKDTTYQAPFPEAVLCRDCKNLARPIMLIHDDEGILVEQRPEKVRVWPHDSSVTAIYLCTNCGSMRARWNQG